MNNVNQMLLIATVLDPRYKLDYVEYYFCDIYNDNIVGRAMTNSLKDNLLAIYYWYVQFEESTQSSEETRDMDSTSGFSSASHVSTTSSGSSVRMLKFKETFTTKNSVE
ncbi:zinc finger BED domain-containing protein RICESLEEPER 1-like [Abeliophyllum distichum]|uniref:Zinc finger BED domain-containing protein RICESLEEPER 1-like n=1 Tax=Abeliophyllum distichum TaxID=126358 RepID=A0ABD1PD37_9LAMI